MNRFSVGISLLLLALCAGGCSSSQCSDAHGKDGRGGLVCSSGRYGPPPAGCNTCQSGCRPGCPHQPQQPPPPQVIVQKEPCGSTKGGAIDVPQVTVVVETDDNIVWNRTVTACGPDGKKVMGTATKVSNLKNTQTITASGSGGISSTLECKPGGECSDGRKEDPKPAPTTSKQ